MVNNGINIGIEGIPKMYRGQLATVNNGSNVQLGIEPNIRTDIVGQGYPDSTGLPPGPPIMPPPGSAPGAVIDVNPPPNPFQGIQSRNHTPNNPPEQAGIVVSSLTNKIYQPIIQYTPKAVQP